MSRCKRCGIRILDDTLLCPLCRTVLTEEGQEEKAGEQNYPNVKKNTSKFQKAGRILLFLSLALEAVLILVNYLTFSSVPRYWSVITGGVTAAAGGITAAIFFGYLAAILFKPKMKM